MAECAILGYCLDAPNMKLFTGGDEVSAAVLADLLAKEAAARGIKLKVVIWPLAEFSEESVRGWLDEVKGASEFLAGRNPGGASLFPPQNAYGG